jgi:hypothetical protein
MCESAREKDVSISALNPLKRTVYNMASRTIRLLTEVKMIAFTYEQTLSSFSWMTLILTKMQLEPDLHASYQEELSEQFRWLVAAGEWN